MSSASKGQMSPALTSPDPAALMKSRPKPRSRSPTPPPNGASRISSRHGGTKSSNGEGGTVTSSGRRERTSSLDRGSSPLGGIAGDLLLKQTRDGLVMSPALHRRRLLTGVAEAEDNIEVRIKKTASSNSLLGQQQQQPGQDKEMKRSLSRSRSRRGLVAGRSRQSSAGSDAGDGAGVGGGVGGEEGIEDYKMEASLPPIGRQITKQRSSTWDEPGVRKYVGEKPVGDGGGGEEGEGESGGRPKSFSLDGLGKGRDPPKPSGWEHLDAFQALGSMFQQELYHEKTSGFVGILSDKMQVPLLIILVGVLGALAGMVVDYCSSSARLWRINLAASHNGSPFQWVIYSFISLSLTLSMCAITHYLCPTAAGGGVPEIKAVLSGAGRPGLLTPRLVVVKALGVIVANAAGLSVGKEGPLIHITCAIADTLMATNAFRTVRLNTTKRLEVLACACAAGVAATFGSVFGGTLFSVEVTATAYRVNTLPATFFCAVVVAVVYWMTGKAKLFSLLDDDTLQAGDFSTADMLAWCLLGIVCGLVGAGFVAALSFLSAERNDFLRKTLPDRQRKMRIFVFVALCTLLVTPSSMIEAIGFSDLDPVGRQRFRPFVDRMYEQHVFGTSWKLLYLLLLKTWTTIFSVVQPLPLGLFSPVFVIGGLMGRVFGEVAHWADKYIDNVNINFKPWEFALIGSAAFSAGVTRAVSTAVIVFELSGQNHLRLPLGVALMISYFIANRFTKGIYDSLMDTNGTPYLHEVGPEDRNVPAENVMVPLGDLPHLSLGSTGKDASEIVTAGRPGQVIPVVQSMNDKVLVGVVLWNDLAIALADYLRRGTMPLSSSAEQRRAVEGYGSTRALAAAATEREREESGRPRLERGESGDVGPWPRLSSVAKALGGRVGWLPRMRLAEPALLEQLDIEEMTSDGELKGEKICGVGAGGVCGEAAPAATPPSGAAAVAATSSGLPPRPIGVPFTTSVESNSIRNVRHHGENFPLLPVYPSLNDGEGEGNSSSRQEGAVSLVNPREATKSAKASTSEMERANRALLRFFLVREGHKFVPVGGNRRKGAWRELPWVSGSHGVPVVLDPSPYQVTHTTELAKVDLAFRLLKVENAYVCNAGRLVGVVTRDSLRSFMETRQISPMDDCLSLCGGFDCCLPSREDYESIGEMDGAEEVAPKEARVASPVREQLPDVEGWSSFLRLNNASYSSESDGDSTGFGRLVAWLKPGRSNYATVLETSEEEDSEGGGLVRGYGSGYSARLGWHPL